MYKGNVSSWLKHIDFTIVDAILLEISFMIAYAIRMDTVSIFANSDYRQMCLILVILDVLVAFANSSYKGILKRGMYIELRKTITHVCLVLGLSFIFMFFTKKSIQFSRLVFLYTIAISIVLMFLGRMGYKAIVRNRMTYRMDKRKVVIVTTAAHVNEVIEKVRGVLYRDYLVTAMIIVGDDAEEVQIHGIPIIAQSAAITYLTTHVVDEVLFHTAGLQDKPNDILEACSQMGVIVHLVIMQNYELQGVQQIEKFAGYTVLTSASREQRIRQVAFKRLLDIVGGVVGCILTGILFIFVAPIIKIQSPGPVFFAQKRVGRNGRIFTIYKFRSMYMDAEERKKELMAQNEMDGLMFKMKDDPRIFPFGKFIRKTSIDEFPQFLNVLKGDMSLVGTRPPTVEEYKQYSTHHKKRLVMKPGITGMWQVSGRSDIKDFEEVVKLDSEYIDNWDIGMDLRIILMTILMVVRRKGSV